MALCTMPTSIKLEPASSLTVRRTLHKDEGTTHKMPKTGEDHISTYVRAVNFLLKSYATDSNIAKATSNIACLKNASMYTSVQFADVLRSKVVRGRSAYLEKRSKEVFIDGVLVNIQSVVRIFWGREQGAHLSQTVQYENTLLQ